MRKNIRVQEPSQEMQLKIIRARTAIASQKQRNIKCPYCCHNSITVYEDTRGHVEAKCTLIVVPITSRFWKKENQPTHSVLEGVPNLTSPSVVLTEQIITIDKTRVMKYLGKVSEEQMNNIDKAIMVSLNLGQSFTDCPI